MQLTTLENFMKDRVKPLFWSIKNSAGVLDKLWSGYFRSSFLSVYDFSILYTCITVPYKPTKVKLLDLVEGTFQRHDSFYLTSNEKHPFFTVSDDL